MREGAEETVQTAMQSMALAKTHAAENTVSAAVTDESVKEEQEQAEKEKTTVAQSGRENIRNRLQESAARLREAYQRQKKKAVRLLTKQMRKEVPERKKGNPADS